MGNFSSTKSDISTVEGYLLVLSLGASDGLGNGYCGNLEFTRSDISSVTSLGLLTGIGEGGNLPSTIPEISFVTSLGLLPGNGEGVISLGSLPGIGNGGNLSSTIPEISFVITVGSFDMGRFSCSSSSPKRLSCEISAVFLPTMVEISIVLWHLVRRKIVGNTKTDFMSYHF